MYSTGFLPCTPVCSVTLHYNQFMTMSADLCKAEVETSITYNRPNCISINMTFFYTLSLFKLHNLNKATDGEIK